MTTKLAQKEVHTIHCDGVDGKKCPASARDDDAAQLNGWTTVTMRPYRAGAGTLLTTLARIFGGKRYDFCPACSQSLEHVLPMARGEDLPLQ